MSVSAKDQKKRASREARRAKLRSQQVKLVEPAADAHRREMLARVDKVQPKIVELVKEGNYPKIAAAAAGVSPRTWDDWIRRAKDGDERLVALFDGVGQALAEAEVELVKKLWTPPLDMTGKADAGWLKAVQFILERTRRERWGDKVEVRIRVEDAMADMMDELEARMTPASFEELVRALVEIGGTAGGILGG